jgi:hypothetical protein
MITLKYLGKGKFETYLPPDQYSLFHEQPLEDNFNGLVIPSGV